MRAVLEKAAEEAGEKAALERIMRIVRERWPEEADELGW